MTGELVPDTAITGVVVEPSLTGDDDLYSDPGKLGLEILGEASDESAYYDFDMFVVWRDRRGSLYYATDSGCSCPSPFEGYKKVSDLTKATAAEIHAALDEWARDDAPGRCTTQSAADLHAKLAAS
jgi:hypothetical protein